MNVNFYEYRSFGPEFKCGLDSLSKFTVFLTWKNAE